MEGIFKDEIAVRLGPSSFTDGKTNIEALTFDYVFSHASARDEKVAALETSLLEKQIDLRQAESMIWPRFDLDFAVEFPIGKDFSGDDISSDGGLFMRYNLKETMFHNERVTAATLRISKVIRLHQAALTDVYYRILEAYLELESERQRLRIEEAALTIAEEGNKYINMRIKNRPIPLEQITQWQTETIELALSVNDCKQNINVLSEVIAAELGLPSADSINIVDIEAYLPYKTDSDVSQQKFNDIATAAWRQRGDINALKCDVVLAEFGILEAKQRRYPSIFMSLGLGSVQLRSSYEKAPLVPSLGITLPLFDMGDAKRAIEIAETRRDHTRVNLTSSIRTLISEIRKANISADSALQDLQTAKKLLTNSQYDVKLFHQSSLTDYAEPLEFFRRRIAALKAESRYQRAKFNYQLALIKIAQLQGISHSGEFTTYKENSHLSIE